MFLHGTLLLAALLWTQTSLSSAGKVLVYPVEGSRWINMNIILHELHDRGHELTVVRSSRSSQIPENAPHYRSLTIQVTEAMDMDKSEQLALLLKNTIESRKSEWSILPFITVYRMYFTIMEQGNRVSAEMLRTLLEDKALIKNLQSSKFDLILTDPFLGSGVVLGSYLGLPIVLNVRWIMSREAHFTIAPSPLSHVPAFGSEVSDQMTFRDRLKNLFHYALVQFIDHMVTGPPYQGVISEFIDPETNIFSLTQGVDLWLIRVDFTFEFPRPTMPERCEN